MCCGDLSTDAPMARGFPLRPDSQPLAMDSTMRLIRYDRISQSGANVTICFEPMESLWRLPQSQTCQRT